VDRVHRCGTDVKIYQAGRPDQCEESLLDELRAVFGCSEVPGDVPFTTYSQLARGGGCDRSIGDPLYRAMAEKIDAMSAEQRKALPANMRQHWGRILGHETVITIDRVGSRVGELKRGIGYLDGVELTADDVAFEPGQQCVLQSRIAYYDPPPPDMPNARGVQLLGGNITDLAMNQAGAYATYVRLTPELICSGSVLTIPAGVAPEAAALAEPTACLLDCFQKTTHEVGQDDTGSIFMKGVRPDGIACVIGSGSMALMAGLLATMDDSIVRMGKAREAVYVVRSQAKADFVRDILHDRAVATVICEDEAALPQAVQQQYGRVFTEKTGQAFRGFDDVIVAAGDAATVATAHRLLAPTGGRLMAFAGTRGPCQVDSATWHYGNAGTVGTSGCNTKMVEIALGLFARRSLDPSRLAGRAYRFEDLKAPSGVKAFFGDKHLRPYLMP
jgi:threonine dehydrogenase-like Zn-dependent dehydrogenase